eukprot:gene17332-biopygen12806
MANLGLGTLPGCRGPGPGAPYEHISHNRIFLSFREDPRDFCFSMGGESRFLVNGRGQVCNGVMPAVTREHGTGLRVVGVGHEGCTAGAPARVSRVTRRWHVPAAPSPAPSTPPHGPALHHARIPANADWDVKALADGNAGILVRDCGPGIERCGCGSWAVGCGGWAVGCGGWAVGCGGWAVGCGGWALRAAAAVRYALRQPKRRHHVAGRRHNLHNLHNVAGRRHGVGGGAGLVRRRPAAPGARPELRAVRCWDHMKSKHEVRPSARARPRAHPAKSCTPRAGSAAGATAHWRGSVRVFLVQALDTAPALLWLLLLLAAHPPAQARLRAECAAALGGGPLTPAAYDSVAYRRRRRGRLGRGQKRSDPGWIRPPEWESSNPRARPVPPGLFLVPAGAHHQPVRSGRLFEWTVLRVIVRSPFLIAPAHHQPVRSGRVFE